MTEQLCKARHVPLEVRVEPSINVRNATRNSLEEWVCENGGRERGGLVRCRLIERRSTPLIFMSMANIQENEWLMDMIRRTPFDGQLMVCGPENYVQCWTPVPPSASGLTPVFVPQPAPAQRAPIPTPHVASSPPQSPSSPAAPSFSPPAPTAVVFGPSLTIHLTTDNLVSRVMGRGRGFSKLGTASVSTIVPTTPGPNVRSRSGETGTHVTPD